MTNKIISTTGLIELSTAEAMTIDGGCTSWFCIGYVYEFWDSVKEGFEEGATDAGQAEN